MTKLTKLLEYSYAKESEKREIANSIAFGNLFTESEKELLLSDESDTQLIKQEFVNAIYKGAERKRIMRDVLPVVYVNSNTVKPINGTKPSGNLAGEVAAGAPFPVKTETYASGAVQIKKYGIRSSISHDLLEDQQFGIIETELNKLGEAVENKLNEVVIEYILANHQGTTPADLDPTTAPVKYEHIGDCYEKLGTLGWKPTDIVYRPKFVGQLLTSLSTVSGGASTPLNLDYDGGKLFGLDTHVLDTPSTKWSDTDSSGKYFGIIMDADNYAFIAMNRDLQVQIADDPIHEHKDIVVSIRFGVGMINNDAAVRIATV